MKGNSIRRRPVSLRHLTHFVTDRGWRWSTLPSEDNILVARRGTRYRVRSANHTWYLDRVLDFKALALADP